MVCHLPPNFGGYEYIGLIFSSLIAHRSCIENGQEHTLLRTFGMQDLLTGKYIFANLTKFFTQLYRSMCLFCR